MSDATDAKHSPIDVILNFLKGTAMAVASLGSTLLFCYAIVCSVRQDGLFGLMPPFIILKFFELIWDGLVWLVHLL